MREIITDLSTLHERAEETILQEEEKVNNIIQDLKEILYSDEKLLALSAPQIGYNSRIFCIKFEGNDVRAFINPMIIKTSKSVSPSIEKIAGIEDEYLVPRFDEIEAVYQTPVGAIETNVFKDVSAFIFQNMTQTVDGLFISDFGLKIVPEWYSATEEEKEEVVSMYLSSLNLINTGLQKEINDNEDLKQCYDAINFMTDVATGKVTLEKDKDTKTKKTKTKKKTKKAKK